MVRPKTSPSLNTPGNTRPRHLRYTAIPLLMESTTYDMTVEEFDKVLVLIRGGDFILANRLFKRGDSVDFHFCGNAAYRDATSDRLHIRVAGANGFELYIYEHQPGGFFQEPGWFRLVRREVP